MQCTKCTYDNPADALFCMKCGAKVENLCASCNTVNPAEANFSGRSHRMNDTTLVRSNVQLHPEMPVAALAGLFHLGVAAVAGILGRTRCRDNGRVHDGSRAQQQPTRREKIAPRYVERLSRLSFVAPRIVEAICQGRQAADLNAETLLNRIDLPLEWSAQLKGSGIDQSRGASKSPNQPWRGTWPGGRGHPRKVGRHSSAITPLGSRPSICS